MDFLSHLWIIKYFPASTYWAVTTVLVVILIPIYSLLLCQRIKQACLHFFQGVFLKSETKLLCYQCNCLCSSLKKIWDLLKDKTNVARQHPSPLPNSTVPTVTQLTSEIFPSTPRYSACVSFMYQNPWPWDKKWQERSLGKSLCSWGHKPQTRSTETSASLKGHLGLCTNNTEWSCLFTSSYWTVANSLYHPFELG